MKVVQCGKVVKDFEIGKLGNWEIGKLGNWEIEAVEFRNFLQHRRTNNKEHINKK